jgi:hypothetical protein
MKISLALTLIGLALFTFGCGNSDTYETADGSVTVSQDGDAAKYEIQSEDGKTTMTTSDSGVAIPETFPKDVPIPNGAVAQLTMTQGKNEMLHLRVPGTVAEMAKSYPETLKAEGWTIESSMNMGDSSMIHAKKDNRQCTVMVVKDDSGTTLQLSVTQP